MNTGDGEKNSVVMSSEDEAKQKKKTKKERQTGKKVRCQLAAGICRRISKGLTLIEGKEKGAGLESNRQRQANCSLRKKCRGIGTLRQESGESFAVAESEGTDF